MQTNISDQIPVKLMTAATTCEKLLSTSCTKPCDNAEKILSMLLNTNNAI